MALHSPPRFLLRILRWFCKPDYHADIEGDLLEFYERRAKSLGQTKASWLLFFDVVRLFRPGLIRSWRPIEHTNTTAMFYHNLLISFRNFKRYKMSFAVNLVGLSTGLACVILIFLWVTDELNMDQSHEHRDRLYQVLENVDQGGGVITRKTTAGPTAAALAAEMPEVEMALTATFEWVRTHVVSFGKTDVKAGELVASPTLFQMFSFPLIEGNKGQVLREKMSIVITETLARRLFGSSANVIGKTLIIDHKKEYHITGIMADLPRSSSVQFEYVITLESFLDENDWLKSWFNTAPQTYVLLKAGTDAGEFSRKIANLVKQKTEGQANHRTPFVRLFSRSYLYDRYVDGKLAGGRIEYVRLFSLIAGFILLIACINFMNLSTARASRRIKEVGVKKVAGARRGTLIWQYLSESTLLVLLSVVVALAIAWLLLPKFNIITGKGLTFDLDVQSIGILAGIVLVTGIIAGSYPALYLSRLSPATVLKGKINSFIGEAWARMGLVVFQFAMSIVLIVSVLVVYKQIEFIQTKNLGFDKDNILIIEREGAVVEKQQTFLEEVRNIPGVIACSSSGHDMTGHNGGTYGISWPGKDPEDRTEFERITANYGLIELLGIEVREGRSFSEKSGADMGKIIFNEAAIKFMDMKDPIGKTVKFGDQDGEIIGVVKDFNFETFHEPVKPAFFFVNPRNTGNILIKIEAGKQQQTLARLEKFYNNFNPGFPFTYRFIDDDYQKLYTAENRVGYLSKYFAVLAILISCLGLFGLAAFTAERRVKEIGVRKALGCGSAGIVYLLTAEFTRMVMIAIGVALPVSWFVARQWLDSFVFHIQLQWWFFAASGLVALVIAGLTVAVQTFKAASVSPVECLRAE